MKFLIIFGLFSLIGCQKTLVVPQTPGWPQAESNQFMEACNEDLSFEHCECVLKKLHMSFGEYEQFVQTGFATSMATLKNEGKLKECAQIK